MAHKKPLRNRTSTSYEPTVKISSGVRPSTPAVTPPEVANASPTDRYGRYVRTRKIGAGITAEVWAAWDTVNSRWVALKLIKRQDSDRLARYLRDAQAAVQLNHPNIAATFEVGEAQGVHYVAMQLVEGQKVQDFRWKELRPLIGFIRDAVLGIQHAHEMGIFHRDIKPDNLIVSMSPRPQITVLKFGQVQVTEPPPGQNREGDLIGTAPYMSPEHVKTHRLDARSDVYSMGASLYELLTGSPPHPADSPVEIFRKILHDKPAPPRAVKPAIDERIEKIVLKCLENSPEHRYPTMKALADDLTRWMDGKAPIEMQTGPSFPAGRIAIGAGALAAIILAIILIPKLVGSPAPAPPVVVDPRVAVMAEADRLWRRVNEVRDWTRKANRVSADIRAELEKTERELTGFVDLHPDLPHGLFIRSKCRFSLCDFQGAEKDLERALEIDSTFSPAALYLGQVRLERYLWTFYGLEETVADRRDGAENILSLAEKALEQGLRGDARKTAVTDWGLSAAREEEAGRNLAAALKEHYVDGNYPGSFERLTQAQAQWPWEEFCRRIADWARDAEEKTRWLDEAVALAPHSAAAHLDRGTARQSKGDLNGAIQDYTRAIAIHPEISLPYLYRGVLRLRKRDAAAAIEDFTRALSIDPISPAAFHNRSIARFGQGDLDGALSDSARTVKLKPGFADGFTHRAVLLNRARDYAGAIEAATRALDTDPKSARALCSRGFARFKLGQVDDAIDDQTRALVINLRFAEAYVNRGIARQQKHDLDGAILDFSKALEIDQSLSAAWSYRGGALSIKGDFDGALRDLDQAIRLDPQDDAAHYNRGNARNAKADPEGAIADYSRAIEINPRHAEAHAIRGSLRAVRGEKDKSIADFEKALEVAPPDWNLRGPVEKWLRIAKEK